jgi:CheY-like chemotaxis protein
MANYGYLTVRHPASDAKPLPIVLVVDDDPDIRDTIAEVLSDEGYPVELASNGREALAVLETDRAKPGLILLDLMMPVLDGWGFMAELQKMPRLAAIPVVVFSAHGANREAIGALGARGFLRKPLQLHELLELVGRCALN